MESWKKLLLAAGGAAGVAAVVYLLLKEETEAEKEFIESVEKKASAMGEVSKEQVLLLLQEIIQTQEQVKGNMKQLTQELLKDGAKVDFEQMYKKIKELQPDDPLEKKGLSMMEFDQMLQKYQNDPIVREAIAQVMGAPDPSSLSTGKAMSITVDKIVSIQKSQQETVEAMIAEWQSLPDKASYDMQIVAMTAQVVAGAKVEKDFGFTKEDIDGAMMMHHQALGTNKEFADISKKMEATMSKLMGGR